MESRDADRQDNPVGARGGRKPFIGYANSFDASLTRR
jgi:hypothetical protein